MHLRLIAPSDAERILVDPSNEGYEPSLVRRMVETLADQGHTYEMIDSGRLSSGQLERFYNDVSGFSMRSHVQISAVFGSGRKSGLGDFGVMVPALLVYDQRDGKLVGVYPHRTKGGPLKTIVGFLQAPPA